MSTRPKRAIPQASRRAVALRYGCQPGRRIDALCYWCGAAGQIVWFTLNNGRPSAWVWFSHELDHLTPEALGGTGDPDNLVLACRACNRRRGHRVAYQPLNLSAQVPEKFTTDSGAFLPGREGKGREQGREEEEDVETQASSVTYPNARPGSRLTIAGI